MWIITRSENDYDQYGDYFEMAFETKPSKEELEELGFGDADHLLKGGGRRNSEDTWFHLFPIKRGEQYKQRD